MSAQSFALVRVWIIFSENSNEGSWDLVGQFIVCSLLLKEANFLRELRKGINRILLVQWIYIGRNAIYLRE